MKTDKNTDMKNLNDTKAQFTDAASLIDKCGNGQYLYQTPKGQYFLASWGKNGRIKVML